MIIGFSLTIVLISLNIIDMTTTEYTLRKLNAYERNPLWKNNKKRLIMYPFKLILPIILEFAGNYGEEMGFLSIRIFAYCTQIGLIILYSLIGLNNTWVLLTRKIELKRCRD